MKPDGLMLSLHVQRLWDHTDKQEFVVLILQFLFSQHFFQTLSLNQPSLSSSFPRFFSLLLTRALKSGIILKYSGITQVRAHEGETTAFLSISSFFFLFPFSQKENLMIKFIHHNVLRTIMLYEIYGISYTVISCILRG